MNKQASLPATRLSKIIGHEMRVPKAQAVLATGRKIGKSLKWERCQGLGRGHNKFFWQLSVCVKTTLAGPHCLDLLPGVELNFQQTITWNNISVPAWRQQTSNFLFPWWCKALWIFKSHKKATFLHDGAGSLSQYSIFFSFQSESHAGPCVILHTWAPKTFSYSHLLWTSFAWKDMVIGTE